MPHEIASVVKCKLCPPATAKSIAGPTLVLGPGQSNRVGRFMESLTEHIVTAHPAQHEYLQQKALEFMGLQTVMQYTTTDEGIRFSRNWLRWQIHQATLNARIPDDKLEAQSAEFALQIVELVVRDIAAGIPLPGSGPVGKFDHWSTVSRVTDRVIELTRGIRNELQEPAEPTPPKGVRA